jgi:hypothetical protein
MLFLSRSNPLTSKLPFFMLDVRKVVDSPTESLKCVGIRIEQVPEAPAQNSRNRIVWFGKSNGPVLSGHTTVKGTAELLRGCFFSDQAMSGRKIAKNHDNLGS